MASQHLITQAQSYLDKLCIDIPTRRVGSAGNRAATSFVAHVLASLGFHADCPEFDCIDWTQEGARLVVGDELIDAFVSPYSLGCHVRAPLVVVSAVDELETANAVGKVLLMRGEIAKEQLMPKNFTFYNPDEHKRIIHLLETKQPQAIIAATSENAEMVGGLSPFPLIEDGDFDIPSAYLTETQGNRLAQLTGKEISLDIHARRIPAKGCNVIARTNGDAKRRVVLTAHIDSKDGSPGALDNAAGVVTLLLIAELLRDYAEHLGVEIAVLNGEDHYSAAGEVQYLKRNQGRFAEIFLCINLDDLGYREGNTAYSLYECPDPIADSIHKILARHDGIVLGEPWYQGDHMIFVQNGVPALALASERMMEILLLIPHTPKDTVEMVDCAKLVDAAMALRDLVHALAQV